MNEAEERFLDALYRGIMDSDQLQHALNLLQDLFACRSAVLVMVDAQLPRANFVSTSGVLLDHLQLYTEKYSRIDPAPGRFLSLPAGTAKGTNQLFSPEHRAGDPFYNEFFVPIGLMESIGGPLYSEQGNFAMVALMRGVERAPFDDSDIEHLERLMPHIARVLQLRRTFFRIDSKNVGLQATLDHLRPGLALLTGYGETEFVNATLRGMAQRGEGFTLGRKGQLLPANIDARRSLDTLLADVAVGGEGGVVPVPRNGARDYVVLVAPSPSSSLQTEWERRGPRGAIVIVHDPDMHDGDSSEVLERGLRLTRGAARLMAALAARHDLKTFAEAEGVTIHTARFHLRSALARTGAKTQAELVGIAVRLLRDFALGELPSWPAIVPCSDSE